MTEIVESVVATKLQKTDDLCNRKRGMNVSEERKITAGTISGATFKSIDIEPSIIVDGKSYTASEFNKAVEMLKQPQLNENQQKWINRLTINYSWYGGTAQHALHATLQEPEMPDLPQNEFAQVLEVFSKWVQEQEEE
ncbi:hypothetical protein [Enterococcus casseliflavus]|uniref:hypothetical protein n=1 Tax=Enterococcus casseliflavus TaxID=37734 RepID=UPI003D14D678